MDMLHIYFDGIEKIVLVRSKKDTGPWRLFGRVVSTTAHDSSTFVVEMSSCIDHLFSYSETFTTTAALLKASKEKSWKSFVKRFDLLVVQWDEKSNYTVQLWERTNDGAYTQPRLSGRCFKEKEALIYSVLDTIKSKGQRHGGGSSV